MSEHPDIDPSAEAAARRIAHAFAVTCAHHRRTALMACGVACVALIAGVLVDRIDLRSCLLVLGIVFFVIAYRTIRLARQFVDPSRSPVLLALATDPASVAMRLEPHHGGGPAVVVQIGEKDSLALRLYGPEADADGEALIEAFRELARVRGEP